MAEFQLFCPSWPLDVAIQGYRLIMYTYPTSTWINTNGLIDAYLMGCDNARGFASKDDLLRHNPNVHKLYGGPASMLFCNEPDCPRGPGGGSAGFSRKGNLADDMRRKHGRTAADSSRVFGPGGIAHTMILPDVDLESRQRMGGRVCHVGVDAAKDRCLKIGLSNQSEGCRR